MWPSQIIYKINKRSGEKKVILIKKLSMFKLFDSVFPLSKMNFPLIASQGMQLDIDEIVPEKQN
jgi:hypothetical protein